MAPAAAGWPPGEPPSKPPLPPGEGRGGGEAGSTRLSTVLGAASARLADALTLSPQEARLEARVLCAHALGVERAWLIAHDQDLLGPEQAVAVDALVARRAGGEPVAYLLGEREFYGRPFQVSPAVLIPRPDTELLVEAALARLPADPAPRLLDLGTGSGCIALTLALECPRCQVWAVDRSVAALAVARANAQRLGAERVRFVESHWYGALAGATFHRCFDLIVANPPYVAADDPHLARGDLRFEPAGALAAGPQGLDDLERIIAGAPAHLAPGGWLLVEHGWDQGTACRGLFAAAGFAQVDTLRDLAGHERVSLGRHPG